MDIDDNQDVKKEETTEEASSGGLRELGGALGEAIASASKSSDDDQSTDESPKEEPVEDHSHREDEKEETAESDTDDDSVSDIDDTILQRGKDLGFSEDELKSIPGTALTNILDRFETQADEKKRTTAAAESVETPKDEFKGIDPIKVDLSDDFDPELTEKLQSIVDNLTGQFNERLKSMGESTSVTQEFVQEQRAAAYEAQFDQMIAGVDGFGDVLGTGPSRGLEKGSEALKNRINLLNAVTILSNGYSSQSGEFPSQKEIFQQALNMTFADQKASQVKDDLRKQIKKREGSISAPGESRVHDDTPQTGIAAAKATARRIWDKYAR